MIIYPICIVEQIGSIAQLHINSYKYGHDVLYWFKAQDKSRVFHVKLTSPDIIISGFTESAEYTFYTANSTNKVPSSMHTVYFNCDDPSTHLLKLKNYVSVYDDPDYANSIVDDVATELIQQEAFIAVIGSTDVEHTYYVSPVVKSIATPVEFLGKKWSTVEDPQDYEYASYAKLYQTFERYYMLKSKSINKGHNISIGVKGTLHPVFEPGYQITRLDVYVKENDIWRKERIIRTDGDEINLGFDFDRAYRICAYADSEMAYVFTHYQPDEALYSYLTSNSSQGDDSVMDADISLDHEDVDMTPTEISWYKEAASLGASDWVAIRPQFSNISNYILYFFIPSYSLLRAIGGKFYLAAQETDLIYGPDFQCLIEITGEYVGVDYANCYLGGDVYFYIVDENLKPVSQVTHYSFDDPDELESYNEKAHRLEVKNYRKRLESVMQIRFPKAAPEMIAYCGVLASNANSYPERLWRDMLSRMNMTQASWISRPRVFFGIMEEHLSNFTLDRNFFLGDVSFYHATSVFTFPRIKDRNYVLVVCSFNKYNNNIEEMYYPSFNTSIEIQATKFDYTIMYAIDKDSYYRSGFIVASQEDGYVSIYNKDVGVFNDNRLYVKGKG